MYIFATWYQLDHQASGSCNPTNLQNRRSRHWRELPDKPWWCLWENHLLDLVTLARDLTRPHPKWWWSKGNPLFQANLGWLKNIVWPDWMMSGWFAFFLYTLKVSFSNPLLLSYRTGDKSGRGKHHWNWGVCCYNLLYHGWSTFPPLTYPPQK